MIITNLGNSINALIAILLVSGIALGVLLALYCFCEVSDYMEEKRDKLIEDHKKIFKNKEIGLKQKVK
ncbi:hypothetical protein [Clostridium sp. SM-530-WT-3G]|uniref:hypothetical protein n=1 Tax=Clostridium sp. SM-530-WT-3G TaxID=2725303 RepID=UPI00145FA014|nr:hypothetical protein [Clostridium sp. SM-530-WT-3G]NME82502.1 hypothetical protein [Clostridium sp. SM-530-WT-3G]